MLPETPEYIRSLRPYVPGKPIEETQREFGLKSVIKLASNENPLGPSPKALLAIKKSLKEAHRYPDASGYRLKVAIIRYLRRKVDLKAQNIILGNGSNEVIDTLVRTYCKPGDSVLTSQAAFVAFKICAQIQGARVLETPLTPDYRFDLKAILNALKTQDRIRIVYLPNPNNPTGTAIPEKEILSFLRAIRALKKDCIVLMDSAYQEYVDEKRFGDPLTYLSEFPFLMVSRTFSKTFGLGGLRVGYGVASPEITAPMEKVRMPFHISSLSLAAAEAALLDRDFIEKTLKTNRDGKIFLETSLDQMDVPYFESQANFLLIDAQKGFHQSGDSIFQACLKKGVIFRPVSNYGLAHCLRISVGTREENKRAITVLKGLK